jgi:hypothetical protein
MGEYDVAQICVNGHIINPRFQTNPAHNSKFCPKCGAETTSVCTCGAWIRGDYIVRGVPVKKLSIPAFCHSCGKPYPWTCSAIAAARLLAEEMDGLSPAEQEQLKLSLDDILRETPQTPVAISRFKKLAMKAKHEGASALRAILIDIVSESVKKAIWGPQA